MKLYDCIEVIVCCKCVSCAISTMKYMLSVLNVLFIILGAVVCGIGAFLLQDEYMRDTYGASVDHAGMAFIALGALTIIIAIVGCIGAKNYNKKALLVYMVLTFIVMISQLVFGLEAAELASDGGVFAICVKRGSAASQEVVGPDGTNIKVNCEDFTTNGLRVGSYALWQNVWNDAESYRCCKGSYWEEGSTTLKKTFPANAAQSALTRNCKTWTDEQATEICTKARDFESAFSLLSGLQEEGKCCGFGKPYKFGEVVQVGSEGGFRTTKPGDKLGCLRNAESNALLPQATKEQLQQCYGYSMDANKKIPNFPSKCATNNDAFPTLEGYYCNWYAGATGPVSTCGQTAEEQNPFGLSPDQAEDSENTGSRCPRKVDGEATMTALQISTAKTLRFPQVAYQEYDFPVGECPTLCYPFGCAEVIYAYVRNRLAAFSLIILLLILVNTFGFFAACCLTVSHHVTGGQGDMDSDERRKLRNPGNTSERV